jgi:Trypsin-co-occurring domain 2
MKNSANVAKQDSTSDSDLVPLAAVISQVQDALSQYQRNLGTGADALPSLASAEFDFKTTVATTVGGSISLFIFKIGASREKDVVNDVTYSYAVPKPPASMGIAAKTKIPLLKDELAATIQHAAAAVRTAGTLGSLTFSKLTINLQFGVKWDGSGGVTAPIQLVTIGLSGDRNKNTVQSVKLVFGK